MQRLSHIPDSPDEPGGKKRLEGPSIDAMRDLYVRHYSEIYRYCKYRLYGSEAAEDATSAVFLRLAERIDTFDDSDEAGIGKWLRGVASNVAKAYLRQVGKDKKLLVELQRDRIAVSSHSNANQEHIDWPTLYGAIQRLKPRHQEMITMRFLEGFSSKDVAKIFGIKHVAVRVTLHRAISKLRKHLKVRVGSGNRLREDGS